MLSFWTHWSKILSFGKEFYSLPNNKILDMPKLNAFEDDKSTATQNMNFFFFFFWKGQKTLWDKEKKLVTSIFSFSHNVLKCLLSHGH